MTRRAFAPVAAALVVIAIAGGAGGVVGRIVGLAGPGGDVQGAESPGGNEETPFVGVGEVPEGWRESGDDTWDFHRAALEPLAAADAAPQTETDPRFVAAASAGLLAAGGAVPAGLPLAVGGALIVPLLGWPLLDARRQRLIAAWLVFGAALAILAVALLARGGSFADRWLGAARLLPFESLVAGAGLALAAWLGTRWLSRLAISVARGRIGDRTLERVRTAATAVCLAVVVALGGLLVGTVRGSVERPGSLSERGALVYQWMARELPPDARVLVNAPTDGVVAVLTGRTGIVDGPLANAGDRPLLARATALALGARLVFAEPNGARAAAYLAREGVSHLLVAVPGASIADVGGRVAFATDVAGIAEGDRFALVRSFDDRVLLFEVLDLP